MKRLSWILVSTTLLLPFCSLAFAQEMPPTLVVTAQVEKMDFHDQITLVGRTEALHQSRIVSQVSGRVVAIEALEGNYVNKGTALVQIDTARMALAYAAKKAEAEQARARATLALGIAKRAEELFAQKMISDIAIDSARVLSAVAKERYNQLQAEEKQFKLDLQDCTIRAPFNGYTGRQLTNVGEWVSIGTPVFEMTQLSRIKVKVDLPERQFGHLAIGSEAIIYVSGDESRSFQGTVTGIAPNASEETHTFPVIITVDNSEGRLGSGMLVRATLALNQTFSSLAVSKDAIIRQGGQTMIYTINEGKAAPIPVTTSSTNGEMVAVNGPGLTEGMPVVVRGNERIFPGSPVMTADGPPQRDGNEEPQTEHEAP